LSSEYDERAKAHATRWAGGRSGNRDDRTILSATESSGGKKPGAVRYVHGISPIMIIFIFAELLLIYR
jgi:hypothetical protein